MEKNDHIDKWIAFLDPDNLKGNLMITSLYIAYFESFKEYVVKEVKFFFNDGFADDEFTFSPRYEKEVLSGDKSHIKASLLWLKDFGTITDTDVELYDTLRQYRNNLSHELMTLLFEGLPKGLPEKLIDLITLRIKIERWWVMNIEIPTSPDIDPNFTEEDVITSSEILNTLIFDMLSGDEKKASFYKEEFLKYFKK